MKPISAQRDSNSSWTCGTHASVRWALASLSLSMLMPSLDTSIANAGLPTLAHAFNASFQEVQWIVLAYLLAITTLIVSVGRLGDIDRPPAAVAGRNRSVHGGLAPVRRRAHALAADRRPGGAGPRSGDHDGPYGGLGRRDGAEGEDRERHGAARHDVRDRHHAWPIARRCVDRRTRLADDLPRQRAAGYPEFAARASLPARRSSGGNDGAAGGLRHCAARCCLR